MEKVARFMEHFWLAVAIAGLLLSFYTLWTQGFEVGKQYLLIPAIASAMWMYRRFTRQRMAAWRERDEERPS